MCLESSNSVLFLSTFGIYVITPAPWNSDDKVSVRNDLDRSVVGAIPLSMLFTAKKTVAA